MLYNKQEKGNGAVKGQEGCHFKRAWFESHIWTQAWRKLQGANSLRGSGTGASAVFEEQWGSLCLCIVRAAVFTDTGPWEGVQMKEGRQCCALYVLGEKAVSLWQAPERGCLLWFSCLFSFHLCSVPVAPPCPEWAQQELSRTAPWRAAVAESWFPCSNLSGASSNLMESFW